MRIIGGLYRSRRIKMVGVETTRETTDMVRESIFNLMSSLRIEGVGLDLFSGSGAMGLEALSRGLDFCYFNDKGREAYKITQENIKELKLEDKTKVLNRDYKDAIKMIDKKLDMVFLDPPYKLDSINEVLQILKEDDMLNENAYIVIEAEKEYQVKLLDYYEIYKERIYGIRKIVILRLA